MAVPVEEAIAALATFSLEDDQAEVQGPGVWVSTDTGATDSPIQYSDVSAYRLSLSEDTKALNQLNALILEGKEMGSVLYTYRSCVKALPQLPDSMKQSQAELYLETYQVLDLEMSRLREIQRWQASAASKLAADMQRFSRPERRINGPTVTHLWSMLKLLDTLVQLDHLKNAKASIPNDFSWYKRTFTQVSVQWHDTDSMREELDDLQIFLSTRWAILLNLHAEMFRVNNVEDILQVLIVFAVESLELDFALLFPERHILLRALPILVVLATSSEKDSESLYKRVKINRLINIFKNDPVIPAFPDLHLSPAAIMKELSMYFQKVARNQSTPFSSYSFTQQHCINAEPPPFSDQPHHHHSIPVHTQTGDWIPNSLQTQKIRSDPDLMPPKPTTLIFLGFLLLTLCHADPDCPKTSPLVNLESEFKMLQHQLRGSIKILDDCSFKVSNFDMLSGSDVHWWGAVAPDFNNLTAGFVVSDQKLNQTYKSASFTVRLRDNVTWDQIQVLAVWDLPTSSDFGHILLRDVINRGSDLAPSPSPASDSGNGTSQAHTEPTMLVNCKSLSDSFRIRWTLRPEENVIDIGLEAATGSTNYMAFGWATPKATKQFMLGADVAVAGFDVEGMPFVSDFYITKYSECTQYKDGSAKGVCPDTMYQGSAPNGLLNNTKLVYGHRRDAVSFIRYQRPLESADQKYDVVVNHSEKMVVIWALGPIRPPDTLQPYYLPQNHGGPQDVAYGYLQLNVSEHVDDCYGPIDAQDKEDQHLIIADAKAPLVVTSGPAVHYPDPPNPSKVLYINKKEAPVLRVERGVPVTFSIQAGHDVALYITSDPLGGNATLRNTSETIYAGGPESQGVQASPKELVWAPDRNTPNLVYYQSLYDQKMGYKVQVVDGGLPDMYNSSVILDDQQVTLFWTLAHDSISIAVRGEKKSGFLAIGFGRGMVNSYAYVGWIDNIGKGRVNTYWIDGKDASSVHPTYENLTYVRCRSENGIITFEFTRPLKPSCGKSDKPECKNIIDRTTPLKVIWAMGATWSDDHLSDQNMHFVTSSRPIRVLLMRGSAEAEQDLQPVLAVHGFMMFLAWAILLPGGVLAARYLKHVKGDGWYRIHVYLQYSGLAIVLLALLFAVAELRGFFFGSLHVKFGTTAIFLVCMQPVNAYLRPKRPNNGEQVSSKRLMWEYLHVIGGRSAIVVGFGALFTGLRHLGDRYGGENVGGLNWALIVWFLICAVIVIYLEYCERQRRRDRSVGRSNWVLGNLEEDDSVDLLSPNGIHSGKESRTSGRMEVQLEPLNR